MLEPTSSVVSSNGGGFGMASPRTGAKVWYSNWLYGEICRQIEASREDIEGLRAYSYGSGSNVIKRFRTPDQIEALKQQITCVSVQSTFSYGLGHLTGSGNVFGTDGRRKIKFLEEYASQATVLNPHIKDKMGNTAVDYLFRNTKITQSRMQEILGALKVQA